MTPTFLNLALEQSDLFPLKLDSKGRVVRTSKAIGGKTVVRRPQDINGIVIHQTACVFGPPDPIKRHRRALKIPAHVVAFRDGVYAQTAPLLWFLYHGNAFNEHTLGLECEGQYPGLRDDPTTPEREDEETFWPGGAGKPTPLTDDAIATFRAGLRHLFIEGTRLGCPLKHIWAHRQSNNDRRSDPGQEIWEAVVLDYGVKELGLTTRPGDTFASGKPPKLGRPIPTAWQPNGGRGRY